MCVIFDRCFYRWVLNSVVRASKENNSHRCECENDQRVGRRVGISKQRAERNDRIGTVADLAGQSSKKGRVRRRQGGRSGSDGRVGPLAMA